MAYNNYFPAGYQPFNQPQQMYPQANNGIQWVQGIEGAKAHPVGAGQSVLLMDSDANCLYIKSADQTGLPSLRIFDYKERITTPTEKTVEYATRNDLSMYATKEDLAKAVEQLKSALKEAEDE